MVLHIVRESGPITANFSGREFRCRCCGRVFVAVELCEGLEVVRAALGGRPVRVTSGYRCPVNNAKVAGAGRSLHTVGLAADIVAAAEPAVVAATARVLAGIGTFGYVKAYPGFTHVDLRRPGGF